MSTAFTVQPLYTIACWVLYTGSGPATFMSTPTLTFGVDGFQYIGSHVGNSFTLGGALTPYTWQHVVFAYDGTNLVMYINGSFQSSVIAYPYTSASGPLTVASNWKGSVDDVRVYQGALTSSQILALYVYESSLTDPTLSETPYTSPDFSISFGSTSGSPTSTDTGNYAIIGTAVMTASSRPNIYWPPVSINVITSQPSYTSIVANQSYGNGNYVMTASSFLDASHNYTVPFQVPLTSVTQWSTSANNYIPTGSANPGTYIGSQTTSMAYRYDFTYSGVLRTVVIPAGTWTFTLTGAQGGDSSTTIASPGGYGATIKGTVTFATSTLLQYVIGGKGTAGGSHGGGGGGGATYVRTYIPAPLPQPTWGTHISGTANEYGQNVTLDSTGSAYVVGVMSAVTPASVYQANDTVYTTFSSITGQTQPMYIVKYSPQGYGVWTTQIATGTSNFNSQIVTDSSNNLYVAGQYTSGPTVYNADGSPFVPTWTFPAAQGTFIAKYLSSGSVQWATVATSSVNQAVPIAHDIVADTTGVYVSVAFTGTLTIYSATNGAIFTTITADSPTSACIIKYDATGGPQWARKIGGTGYPVPMSMTLDPSGGLYVHLLNYVSSGSNDVYNADGTTVFKSVSAPTSIVKYITSTGVPSWVATLTGVDTNRITSSGISATSSGLYVTGSYTSTFTAYNQDGTSYATTLSVTGTESAYLVKYNLAGLVQWVTNITCAGTDLGTALATTSDGLFVSGTMNADVTFNNAGGGSFRTITWSGSANDSFLVKYNTTGSGVEAFKMTTTNGNQVTINGLAANPSGNVFAIGTYTANMTIYNSSDASFGTLNNLGGSDAFLVNFSSPPATGTLLFVAPGGGGAGPPGVSGNNANPSQSGTGLGGTRGNTGSGGGGGYSGDGDGGIFGGKSFLNGSAGGSGTSTENAAGGIGGGGANYTSYPYASGGGGGGYTGGNGGDNGSGGSGGYAYFIGTATGTTGVVNTSGGNGSFGITSGAYSFAGEWIQIQLPQPIVPASFSLYEVGNNNAMAYALGASNDGTSWTLLYNGTNSDQPSDQLTTKALTGITKSYNYYRYVVTQVSAQTYNGAYVLSGLTLNIISKGFYVPNFQGDGPLTVVNYFPSQKNYTLSAWVNRTSGTSLFQQGTSDLLLGVANDNTFTLTHNGSTVTFNGADPLWANSSNTVLTPFPSTIAALLHCQDLTDSSQYASPITSFGTVAVSSSQTKFGGSSLIFSSETATQQYLTVAPTSNIFGFVTSAFTIDFWIYPLASALTPRHIMGNSTTKESDAYRWYMSFTSNEIGFYGSSLSGSLQSTTTIPNNTWTHVAIVRSGLTFTLFINGTIDTTAVISGPIDNGGIQPLIIGRGSTGDLTNYGMYGYMDEIRVTQTAVFTQNFTPATSRYTTSVTLSKLSSATNDWNAAAITSTGYVSTANVSMFASQTNGTMSFGLTESTTVPTNDKYTSQAYSWRFNYDGTLSIYENGTFVGSYGTYNTSQRPSITYEHGAVTYYFDGIAKRSVARTAGNPLYATFTPYATVTPATIAVTTATGGVVYVAPDIYVSDGTTNTVKRIVINGGVVTTFAAGFSGLSGITYDPSGAGYFYVTDTSAKSITRISLTGTKTTVVTGLISPSGITNDGLGNLYFIDGTIVKKVVISSSTVTNIATGFTAPVGITYYSPSQYLYVTDSGSIKRIIISSGTTLAVSTGYTTPAGITYDGNGSLYVTDTSAAQLIKYEISTNLKNQLGLGLIAPAGVAFNGSSNVYIADSGSVFSHRFGAPAVNNVTFDNFTRSIPQWQHLIVTYTGDFNTASLYLDGNLESTRVVPVYTTTTNSLQIATSLYGNIDDVRVYGAALSASECSGLYAYESSVAGEALIIANPGYVQIASIATAALSGIVSFTGTSTTTAVFTTGVITTGTITVGLTFPMSAFTFANGYGAGTAVVSSVISGNTGAIANFTVTFSNIQTWTAVASTITI